MSKISDTAPLDTSCTDFGFAEVDFPRLTQPRLVIGFANGLQLVLCDPSDLDLAAEFITALRLIQRRQLKGVTQ